MLHYDPRQEFKEHHDYFDPATDPPENFEPGVFSSMSPKPQPSILKPLSEILKPDSQSSTLTSEFSRLNPYPNLEPLMIFRARVFPLAEILELNVFPSAR